ncbi:uncharacterized [Tachysurus ichikawai]
MESTVVSMDECFCILSCRTVPCDGMALYKLSWALTVAWSNGADNALFLLPILPARAWPLLLSHMAVG